MSAGEVIVAITAMVCLTLLIIMRMLVQLYKQNEKADKSDGVS